jgi:hypothetical protein
MKFCSPFIHWGPFVRVSFYARYLYAFTTLSSRSRGKCRSGTRKSVSAEVVIGVICLNLIIDQRPPEAVGDR